MNASDLKEIIISKSQTQETFLRKVKHLAQQTIGEQYDAVYDFFCEVLEHKSMYKIISARRCQVLFELFSLIVLLEDANINIEGTFISSNAIERHLDQLRRKDVSVLIVDDVLIHGRGVKRLYEILDSDYIRTNIEIAVFCRAINASYIDEQLKKLILKGYLTAFDYEWREISCRFVDFIESSAIPYESFAGSFLASSDPSLSIDSNDFTYIVNSSRSRVFFEKRTLPLFLREIGYDACLRIYSNWQAGVYFAVPYVFLKNIKSSKCDEFIGFVARKLNGERYRHIVEELSLNDEKSRAYRMRLLSSLVNRFYGLYLTHTYGILKDTCPNHINMELCFSRDVALELDDLRWIDVSDLLATNPPFEEGSVQEDEKLTEYLLMPDACENDAMYRFLSMYYYINGQLDELAVIKHESRRSGLTMGQFYKVISPTLYHNLTAAQIKCWDFGQASGIMRSSVNGDCIAMYGIAGEQNFRFILQENQKYFRVKSKNYALGLSGLEDDSNDTSSSTDDSDESFEKDMSFANSRFIMRNKKLLEEFLRINKDSLEEWYIPQFIS